MTRPIRTALISVALLAALGAVALLALRPDAGPIRATATPTPPPSIQMIASAATIRYDSAQPGGQWIAFWLTTQDHLDHNLWTNFPPGDVTFYNLQTGQECAYPDISPPPAYEVDRPELDQAVAWTPDGVLVTSNGQVSAGVPCGDFQPANMPFPWAAVYPTMTSGSEQVLVSPTGRYRATVVAAPRLIEGGETGLFDATMTITGADGSVLNAMEWTFGYGEFDFVRPGYTLRPPVAWVGDTRFLIARTLDDGPLLVEVGGESVQVVADLFGLPLDGIGYYQAIAAPDPARPDGYHLAISHFGTDTPVPSTWLYHSHDGQVEQIPFRLWPAFPIQSPNGLWGPPAFSPDGGWLLLDGWQVQGEGVARLLAQAVDPAAGEPVSLVEGLWGALWSPVGSRLVYWTGDGALNVISFPGGQAIGRWAIDGFALRPLAWSPDGAALVVLAEQFLSQPMQPVTRLYVIRP